MSKLLELLLLMSPETFGVRMIEAAEAFESPPLSRAARRWAAVAVGTLLAGAALLVTAALVNGWADGRPWSEKLGWAGLGCLVVCVFSGLRYKDANREALALARAQADQAADSDHRSAHSAQP